VPLRLPLGAPPPLLPEPPLVAVVPPLDLSPEPDRSPLPDVLAPPEAVVEPVEVFELPGVVLDPTEPLDLSPLPGVLDPANALWLLEPLDDWPAAPPPVKLRPSFAVTCELLAGRGVGEPSSRRLSACACAEVPVLADRAATLATAGAGVGSCASPRLLPAKSRVP